MFRPTLEELDLKTGDDLAISTAIYDLTRGLRSAIIRARVNLEVVEDE